MLEDSALCGNDVMLLVVESRRSWMALHYCWLGREILVRLL